MEKEETAMRHRPSENGRAPRLDEYRIYHGVRVVVGRVYDDPIFPDGLLICAKIAHDGSPLTLQTREGVLYVLGESR